MGRRFRAERRKDPYYRAAQRDQLRSRAAFKLAHLAGRFPILRPGGCVLDLGAAPGGWSLTAHEAVGPGGTVVAVDVRKVEPIPGVRLLRGEVGSGTLDARLAGASFDTVLSDMAPRISGAYATDHARSVALARSAWEVARSHLAYGGSFVVKMFDGDLVAPFARELRPWFQSVHQTKPPASRVHSSELFLVGLGFHAPSRRAEGA